jgi:N-succinyl-L-ornithine transcarbamylase
MNNEGMKHFLSVDDVPTIEHLVEDAKKYKLSPNQDRSLGKHKTLGLIFMNPSLRTRLSTHKAALNLGMDVMVMNFTGEGWTLETRSGIVMQGEASEHIQEAAAVVGAYCDVIGLRAFPSLTDREADYQDVILNDFVKYSGKPVINLESATLHPCQSLADIMTIEENRQSAQPKVVLMWAPHPKALPQSVANSFVQWIKRTDYDFVVANPEGYDLPEQFVGGVRVVHSPEQAYEGADFIYAKNWSSYDDYGKVLSQDSRWMIDERKMNLTNNARFMHCLPVRRNVVVSDAVIDSERSIVIEQAGNRVWAAQSVLKQLLHNG